MRSTKPPIWLLMSVTVASQLALTIFLPAMPALAQSFDVAYGTAHQRQVLDFIQQHHGQHGVAPSLREIQAHFGLASPFGSHPFCSIPVNFSP